MTPYERLLQYAQEQGIHVRGCSDARCLGKATKYPDGNYITIDFNRIRTSAVAAEVLAHELGHFATDSFDEEHSAWEWAVSALAPRGEVYNALENNDGNTWLAATEMGVSHDFFVRALRKYEEEQ